MIWKTNGIVMEEFDKEKMNELMMELLDGNLSGELKDYVEKYIAKHEEAKKEFEELREIHSIMDMSVEFEPEASLKNQFELDLAEESAKTKTDRREAKVIAFRFGWPARIAAGIAILAVGYFIGIQFNSKNNELAQLRKEMETTRQLVMGFIQNQSPSQRIMGVNYSESLKEPDDQILNVLIKTMNEDENINVRLAAVNALKNFSSTEKIKLALINSLDVQTDPIIQIALIDALVDMNEKRAIDKLKDMVDDERNMQSVQDQAHYGLFKLM